MLVLTDQMPMGNSTYCFLASMRLAISYGSAAVGGRQTICLAMFSPMLTEDSQYSDTPIQTMATCIIERETTMIFGCFISRLLEN